MAVPRIAAVLLAWFVLALAVARWAPDADALFEPAVLAFVLALPLAAALAAHGPSALAAALRDACARDAADLPAERRGAGATILHSLGGGALAAGMLAFLAGALLSLHGLAAAADATPTTFLSGVPALILGPAYGLALKALLFDALAEALEGAGPELASELGEG